jgi:hypothetical protein
VWVDRNGELVVRNADLEVRFRKPDIYQEVDGVRKPIGGGYALSVGGHVGFSVAEYADSFHRDTLGCLVGSLSVSNSTSVARNGAAALGQFAPPVAERCFL